MRISDWSSDVCSSDLECRLGQPCANGSPGQRALSGLRPGAQATRSAGSRCRRRGRAGRAGKQDQEAFEAMNDKDQTQLGKTLWAIADQLRGAMNAADFRYSMLSFLFLPYLSCNYLEAAKKELGADYPDPDTIDNRSEEHTSELQSLMRNSYAVFCL